MNNAVIFVQRFLISKNWKKIYFSDDTWGSDLDTSILNQLQNQVDHLREKVKQQNNELNNKNSDIENVSPENVIQVRNFTTHETYTSYFLAWRSSRTIEIDYCRIEEETKTA